MGGVGEAGSREIRERGKKQEVVTLAAMLGKRGVKAAVN